MAKYVPDVKTQRWVIESPARTKRPDSAKAPPGKPDTTKIGCPFCAGNESATPPEVYRIGGGEKDGPGWDVRVVPNKYPITDTHEVFIHSTSHTDDVDKLPLDQVTRILGCYRDRYRAHESDGQVLIFCNHGYHAGASLAHPHSQLVVVPKQINLDSLSREPINNMIEDNTYFVTYCPDFSQWPYEVWIAPKSEGDKYGDIEDKAVADLAGVFQRALKKIDRVWRNSPIRPKDRQDDPFMYNYYISHGENWFIRIVPRFIHRAGFELGTGLNVNVVDPTEAAKELASEAV
jgi:UDPglucose--hexose-1-phosphate uridylyltransferase